MAQDALVAFHIFLLLCFDRCSFVGYPESYGVAVPPFFQSHTPSLSILSVLCDTHQPTGLAVWEGRCNSSSSWLRTVTRSVSCLG